MIIFILLFVIFSILWKRRNIIKYTNYSIKGYSDLQQDTWSFTPNGIPKIIIKTSWHTRSKMPVQIIEVLEQTRLLNPEYQVYYFDNSESDQFMKDYSPQVYLNYLKIIPGAFKADLFRICILEKYGGCYSDIGHLMYVPFNEICGDANIVLVCDDKIIMVNNTKLTRVGGYSGIHNALMCTIPDHGFFKQLIKTTCQNIEKNYYGENSLDVTGPVMIGKQFNCYFAGVCDNINKDIMNYGYTDYSCDNCRLKILKFVILPLKGNDTFFIMDSKNKILIKTKFDNYYNVMYTSKKSLRYGELWDLKRIYVS
jgi:hypothetical protein